MGGAQSTIHRRSRQGTALLAAARDGDEVQLAEALSISQNAASFCTLDGVTALHIAAGAGRADLLEQLIAALRESSESSKRQPKAARRSFARVINQKNVHGQTPLHLACKGGNPDCVKLLLAADADATLFDHLQQRSCLHYAALWGWAEAIDALLGDESRIVPPTAAAAAGHAAQAQPLRDALVADSEGYHKYVDVRAGAGLAPLHLAAFHGHLAAVQALLRHGASITARCSVAFSLGATEPWTPASTPLHFAAARGRGQVVLEILKAAAQRREQGLQPVDVRMLQDYRGKRPYDVALANGHRSLLRALNPRVPLSAILQPPAPRSVPSLASLAATALREHLQQQLTSLKVEAQSRSAAAAVVQRPRPSSRRGSRPASREGSSHGGNAAAAALAAGASSVAGIKSLPAAVAAKLARRSGSGSRVSPDFSYPLGSARMVRHVRHSSDSLISAIQHPFPAARGGTGGSLRGAGSYAALVASPQLLQPQLMAGGAGSPVPASPLSMAVDASAAPGSTACYPAATSVASVAGCPICFDSVLEVAISPCNHGLCLDCAQTLSRPEDCGGGAAHSAAPPLCPLCRGIMAGARLL